MTLFQTGSTVEPQSNHRFIRSCSIIRKSFRNSGSYRLIESFIIFANAVVHIHSNIMIITANLRRDMVFYMFTKLFVTTKESLQTARNRVRSIGYTQQINLIAVFQSKLVVANSRRTKSNYGEFFLGHSQINKPFP